MILHIRRSAGESETTNREEKRKVSVAGNNQRLINPGLDKFSAIE